MAVKKRGTTKSSVTGERPPVGPISEYLSPDDDAWYSVNLVLEGDTLIVKYREFSDADDEKYLAVDFKTSDQISDFGRRFRALNKQLEASDCSLIKQGMKVCALRVFSDVERRFFDAIVHAVKHEEHAFEDGAEKCSCSFLLSWLHGPLAGTLTLACVEDLCAIQPAQTDPRLSCFLEIAKLKLETTSPSSGLFTEGLIICDSDSPVVSHCKPLCTIQESEKLTQIGNAFLSDKDGIYGYEGKEDVDLGGGGDTNFTAQKRLQWNPASKGSEGDMPCLTVKGGECADTDTLLTEEKTSTLSGQKNGCHSPTIDRMMKDVSHMDLGWGGDTKNKDARYFVLVENLERDVSPSTIVEFIREAISLEIEAFVFLCLSSEPYTNGALVTNCVDELEQLCNYVAKPDQIITSIKGRPWVVTDSSASELARTSFWCLEPDLEIKREHLDGDGLKVVHLGSDEYTKAKKLKDLFLEFTRHQELLFDSLAVEEQKIFNS